MNPIRTILVPYDFSTHSEAALERAAWLAKESPGARIHLLHACALPAHGVTPYEVVVPAGVWDSIQEGASAQLDEVREKIAARGVATTAEVSVQLPGEAIHAAAVNTKADVIVMGTRGLTGVKHALLGSVAERTLRTAPCPVLAVKEDQAAEPIERVLIAVDFSESSDRALATGAALAKQLGAETHLIHAFDLPLTLVTPYEVAVPDGLIREARKAAKEKLDAALERLRADGIEATGHLAEVPSAPAIADHAAEIGADLLVIGTRGHTGLKHLLLGSVAERSLRLAPCSVLVVTHE